MDDTLSIIRLRRWEFFPRVKSISPFEMRFAGEIRVAGGTKVFNGSTTSSRLVSKLADRTLVHLFGLRNSGGENQVSVHLRTIVKAGNKGVTRDQLPISPLTVEFPVRVSVGECLFKFLLAFPHSPFVSRSILFQLTTHEMHGTKMHSFRVFSK